MQLQKFLVFAITILSIIVFSQYNSTQLVTQLFLPIFNAGLWLSFAMIIFGVITYVVVNKNMLK